MRAFILAVTTGLAIAIGVAACNSYGTSVVEYQSPAPAAPVASVSVTLPSSSLVAGTTQRALASVKDANGSTLSGRAIKWFSSSSAVATITDSGYVSAVAPGTATLSAVSEGVAGQAPVTVTPRPPTPIAMVVVAITPAAVVVGQVAHATVALQDSSGNLLSGRLVTWQSGNPAVAVVSSNGDVSAVAPGTVSITAASEGMTASAPLTVSAPAPIPVASVSVSPASSSLQVGATAQLTATTRDANNNVLTGRVVGWSSANAGIASVNSNGLVTAVSAGTIAITALSEGKSSSAAITVNAPAPVPVATVTVSPASANVALSATLQLTATLRDANNNVLTGRQIVWSSSNTTNATVNANGLVSTVSTGTATVTATSEGKSGSAVITIPDPVPPPDTTPPPPLPPPTGSVEPAGMVRLTDRGFNAMNEDGWTNTGSSNYTIQSDATAPKSPSSVGQIRFPAGFVAGYEPAVLEKAFSGTNKTIYISFWLKFSSNFYGQQTAVNKIFHIWNSGLNRLFLYASGTGNGSLTAQLGLQQIVAGGNFDGGSTAMFGPNQGGSGTLARNQWAHWELVLTGNSSGASDGSVEWWINGAKVGSYTGIRWVSGTGTWESMEWAPTWGGLGGTVPADQFMWIDHIYVSGKP